MLGEGLAPAEASLDVCDGRRAQCCPMVEPARCVVARLPCVEEVDRALRREVRSGHAGKKQPSARRKKPTGRRLVAPPHVILLPLPPSGGTSRRLQRTAAEEIADLIIQAVRSVDFFHPAIKTELLVEPDGFHVHLDVLDRETGDPVTIDLRWDLPPFLTSREHALDWIYACVREAWVHELNEALFVDGVRRRDLHNGRGQTIPPPDEAARCELDAFKMQLAAFLMGGPR